MKQKTKEVKMDYFKLANAYAENKYEEGLQKFFDFEEGITKDGWYEFTKNKKRFVEDLKTKFLIEFVGLDPMTGETLKYGKEC